MDANTSRIPTPPNSSNSSTCNVTATLAPAPTINQRRVTNPPYSTISAKTREKADATKAYLEQKYMIMKRERNESRARRHSLEAQMEELKLNPTEREAYRKTLRVQELQNMRQQRKRQTIADFDKLVIIGRGAFGEVALAI